MWKHIPAQNVQAMAKKRIWRQQRADTWTKRTEALALAYRAGEEIDMNPLERIAVTIWLHLHRLKKTH